MTPEHMGAKIAMSIVREQQNLSTGHYCVCFSWSLLLHSRTSTRSVSLTPPCCCFVNPRRSCAARVTVLGPFVCLSVCYHVFCHYTTQSSHVPQLSMTWYYALNSLLSYYSLSFSSVVRKTWICFEKLSVTRSRRSLTFSSTLPPLPPPLQSP